MKVISLRRSLCFLVTFLLVAEPLFEAGSLLAQRRGGGGGRGRSPRQSSNVKRSSPARSGSTSRPSSPSRSTVTGGQDRTRSSPAATKPSSPGRSTVGGRPSTPGRSVGGARSPGAKRSVARRSPGRSVQRGRSHRRRRAHRSRRYRRARWRHHRFWRHRRWYRNWWLAGTLIRTAAFIAIANSSRTTTYTVTSTTYYHYNPWYRRALYEGEEVYVLMAAPVGWETSQLPPNSEIVDVEDNTYYYHEAAFYQEASGGGYVVIEPPVGAEVRSIPEEAIAHEDEGELAVHQFDNTFFTKDVNVAGQEIYRVEPQPPEEELDEIPTDAVTFVADGETYYYVNFNLYVEYEEDGQTGFINAEPDIGAQVDALPEGVTEIEENGITYYQFDMVFFEEVVDENGNSFYEVVGSPDGSEGVELE